MTPSSVIAETPQSETHVNFGQQAAREIFFNPLSVILHPHLLDELSEKQWRRCNGAKDFTASNNTTFYTAVHVYLHMLDI
jgi:hypothetical protein